ncbi:MAG: M4 family metallopeptidase [Bacteroidota bacterium]|nr:M4 family metallopeptidase [Bacteroidota bacterium]
MTGRSIYRASAPAGNNPGNAPEFVTWLQSHLNARPEDNFRLIRAEKDQIGFTHYRYMQTYKGLDVEPSMYIVHTKEDAVISANGDFFPNIEAPIIPTLTETQALEMALSHINADIYKWQLPGEEKQLQWETKNPQATFFPKTEMVIWYGPDTHIASLAYKFDVYAHQPFSRDYVYVDAVSGDIIITISRICEADKKATVETKYNGTTEIIIDSVGPSEYHLAEQGRGGGVFTLDINRTKVFDSANVFTSNDSEMITLTGIDQYALDAHRGAELTYDYYLHTFGRNSIDDGGHPLFSYIHYGEDIGNAFWDGERMLYGDGDGTLFTAPLTSIDVCAHEFTHGLTQHTGGLFLPGEPKALNESFSDIFATMVERTAYPTRPHDSIYTIGEQVRTGGIRKLYDPNLAKSPNTYKGDFWYNPAVNPHAHGQVQTYAFYMLIFGNTGVNDRNDTFCVQGIGEEKASAIVFRALTVYTTPLTGFAESREHFISAAKDLYGDSSFEVIQTTNAWYAVNVGEKYPVETRADFSYEKIACTQPQQVKFINSSEGNIAQFWEFGDSTTSIEENPEHSYLRSGTYVVKLTIATSCPWDKNIVKTDTITINNEMECIFAALPSKGSTSRVTTCSGLLYDDGGETGTHKSGRTSSVTISPPYAKRVRLIFYDFDLGSAADRVNIYDGPNRSFPLIAEYKHGDTPASSLTSTGPYLTVELVADDSAESDGRGFRAYWECMMDSALQEEYPGGFMKIFPNPSHGDINIEFVTTEEERGTITLYNMLGQAVHTGEYIISPGALFTLDGIAYPKGMYILSVETDKRTIREKIEIVE